MVIWDESFQFLFPGLECDELNMSRASITCFDANVIRRSSLVGKFDLVTIFYKEHHELFRQCIALSDVTDKRKVVTHCEKKKTNPKSIQKISWQPQKKNIF